MNEENKKQVIMMIVLIVVAVGVVGFQMKDLILPPSSSSSGNKAQTTQIAKNQKMNVVEVNIDDLLQGIAAVDFDYATERINRDPMRPLIGTNRVRGDLDGGEDVRPGDYSDVMQKNVTGILWDEHDPVAIVDNEVVTLGYTYPNGIVVQEIGRDGVTFKVNDLLIPVTMEEL